MEGIMGIVGGGGGTGKGTHEDYPTAVLTTTPTPNSTASGEVVF